MKPYHTVKLTHLSFEDGVITNPYIHRTNAIIEELEVLDKKLMRSSRVSNDEQDYISDLLLDLIGDFKYILINSKPIEIDVQKIERLYKEGVTKLFNIGKTNISLNDGEKCILFNVTF